jgi:hypothetical protein
MSMAIVAALVGATPMAFVSVEALFLVGAILAAAGAVITGIIAVRASRRGSPDDEAVRRAPHSRLGIEDDPIVAALIGTEGDRRSRFPRNQDRTEP